MLLLRTMSRLCGISLTCGDATTGLTQGSDLGHTADVSSSLSSSLYSLLLLLSGHSGKIERVKIFPNTITEVCMRYYGKWLVLPGNWGKNLLQRQQSAELGPGGWAGVFQVGRRRICPWAGRNSKSKRRPEASVRLLRNPQLSTGVGMLGIQWELGVKSPKRDRKRIMKRRSPGIIMGAGIYRPCETCRGLSATDDLGLFSRGDTGVWEEVSGYCTCPCWDRPGWRVGRGGTQSDGHLRGGVQKEADVTLSVTGASEVANPGNWLRADLFTR